MFAPYRNRVLPTRHRSNFIFKMKVFIIASLAIQLLCLGLVQGQERVRAFYFYPLEWWPLSQKLLFQLPIQIYYEALCPDSVNFVQNQLFPNFAALRDYIDILYVPFGKASSHNDNGIIEFTCQHGPAECTGNRVQSCTLRALRADPDRQTEFVACQMAFGVDQTGQTVRREGSNWFNSWSNV